MAKVSKCELCEHNDGVYDASVLSDWFGFYAGNAEDGNCYVCADCLNEIEEAVKIAWRSKRNGNVVTQEKGVNCGSQNL